MNLMVQLQGFTPWLRQEMSQCATPDGVMHRSFGCVRGLGCVL